MDIGDMTDCDEGGADFEAEGAHSQSLGGMCDFEGMCSDDEVGDTRRPQARAACAVGAGASAKSTHATSPCEIHADASLVRGCGQQSLARHQPKQNIERRSVKTANMLARALGLSQFQRSDSADHDPDDVERILLQTVALSGKSMKPGQWAGKN